MSHATALYVCPMHLKIVQSEPGNCSLCGMTLEILNNIYSNEQSSEWDLRFWVAGILSILLLLFNSKLWIFKEWDLGFLIDDAFFNDVQLILATPIVLWGGWPFFQRGLLSLLNRRLNMFTLIALSVGVAYGYSVWVTMMPERVRNGLGDIAALDVYFETASLITTLVLLGQILEQKAHSRTRQAIYRLLNLSPQTAILIRSRGVEDEIPLSKVQVNDMLRVKPGNQIPVDGVLVEGHSKVDQSTVTGESVLLEKNPGDFVIGGTINQAGSFIMRAERVGENTFLSQVVQIMTEAQQTHIAIQRFVDRVSTYFVSSIVLIALVTAYFWYSYGPEPRISYAILTSIAVLIIACPCALGLATPLSLMMGIGRGASEGILIKNAEAVENIEKVDRWVIDKTGTLTEGKPRLLSVIALDNFLSSERLHQFAASLEQWSEHPFANAIVKSAREKNLPLPPCSEFQTLTGKGVTGMVQHHAIALGNVVLMRLLKVDLAKVAENGSLFQEKGQTVILMSVDGVLRGLLTIVEGIKFSAREVISALDQDDTQVILLTGDNATTALAVAKELNISVVEAEMLPQDKYAYIQTLQQQGHIVAMVGDGINDAPALMQADVGIAIGTGTDIADSADVVLVSGGLSGILKLKRLSHLIMNNVRENLFLAFFYNVLSIPIAAGVFYAAFGWLLSPTIASIAMSLSSLSVVLNALRMPKKLL